MKKDVEYKGLFYGENSERIYYEGGAHFKYSELVAALTNIINLKNNNVNYSLIEEEKSNIIKNNRTIKNLLLKDSKNKSCINFNIKNNSTISQLCNNSNSKIKKRNNNNNLFRNDVSKEKSSVLNSKHKKINHSNSVVKLGMTNHCLNININNNYNNNFFNISGISNTGKISKLSKFLNDKEKISQDLNKTNKSSKSKGRNHNRNNSINSSIEFNYDFNYNYFFIGETKNKANNNKRNSNIQNKAKNAGTKETINKKYTKDKNQLFQTKYEENKKMSAKTNLKNDKNSNSLLNKTTKGSCQEKLGKSGSQINLEHQTLNKNQNNNKKLLLEDNNSKLIKHISMTIFNHNLSNKYNDNFLSKNNKKDLKLNFHFNKNLSRNNAPKPNKEKGVKNIEQTIKQSIKNSSKVLKGNIAKRNKPNYNDINKKITENTYYAKPSKIKSHNKNSSVQNNNHFNNINNKLMNQTINATKTIKESIINNNNSTIKKDKNINGSRNYKSKNEKNFKSLDS